MPPLVKICGITTSQAVDDAIRLGATHIGLVHYEPSQRHVDLKTAAELRKHAGSRVKVALLLVNASQKLTGDALGMVRPDIIQFHGGETPEWLAVVKRLVPAEIWKAVGLKDAGTLERMQKYRGIADRILFDAPAAALPGGTGTRFDWSLLKNHRSYNGLGNRRRSDSRECRASDRRNRRAAGRRLVGRRKRAGREGCGQDRRFP